MFDTLAISLLVANGGDIKLLILISLFYLNATFRGPVDFLREREAVVDINSVRLLGQQTPR